MGKLLDFEGPIPDGMELAQCFGCGRWHRPRTDMDLLCDKCAGRKMQVSA